MTARVLVPIAVSGFSAAIGLWGVFCIWMLWGEEPGALNFIPVKSHSWQMLAGEGYTDSGKLHLTAPGRRGDALAMADLMQPVELDRLSGIRVNLADLGSIHSISLGVSRSLGNPVPNESPGLWLDESTVWVSARDLSYSDDKFHHVTIRIRGAMRPAAVIEQVDLIPERPDFLNLQHLLWRSLVDTSGWTQRSINHNRPDYVPLRVSPVIVTAIWITLTIAFMGVWLIWRREYDRGVLLTQVGVLILAGWVLVDLGWQLSLWKRHNDAIQIYSSLEPEEKRRVEIDADVFDFVEQTKRELSDDSRRLVIFGGSRFSHFRARYFAVPQPVISREGVSMLWVRRMQPGDTLALVQNVDALRARPVSIDADAGRVIQSWALEEIAAPDAEVVGCPPQPKGICEGSVLKRLSGAGPWLVQSPWLDSLQRGIWQAELDLQGGERSGWLRLQVVRKDSQGSGVLWGMREMYLRPGKSQTLKLLFRAEKGFNYQVRLRELDSLEVRVHAIRLHPVLPGGDVVKLSDGGAPPYFLARKLVETDGNVAWELL